MGVGANSSGNKSLNDRRERAAGRQDDRGPEMEAILDANGADTSKSVGGASGTDGHANRHPGNTIGEGGGGGGAATNSDLPDVNASTRPAKRR